MKRAITFTLLLYRVYIQEEKLTPAAKTQLNAATLRPYNTSILIGDIKTEAAKNNAKIWVSLCSLYNFHGLKLQSRRRDNAKCTFRMKVYIDFDYV